MKLKNISILTLFATAATLTCSAQLITTDFEDVDFTTNDNSFPAGDLKNWTTALAVSATGTTNTWVKGGGSGNSSVLQPAASGSAWINPVPAEIGNNFGDIAAGDSFWLDTGIVALAATGYEFTVTQFTRDNTTNGSSLIIGFSTLDNFTGDTVSDTFAAIADSTLTTRTFTLDTATNSEFVGDTLRLYIAASGGNNVSIDNLTVSAIPEPSSFALLSGILALSSIILRRR